MRALQKGLAITGILALLSSSFILGPPLLNESNYNKQFWIEFFIAGYSIIWIFCLWLKKEAFNFQFNLLDAIIGVLLINYSLVALDQNSTLLIRSLPFYYALYYFMSKLVFNNLAEGDFEDAKQFFVTMVPFIILAHISIFIIQKLGLSPFMNSYSPIGSTFGNPDMLGAYLVTLLPFCFFQKQSMRIFGYVAFFLSLIILILLQARSAILATIICGFVWLLLNKRLRLKAKITLSVLPGLLLTLLIIWHPEFVYGRFFVWFIAVKMIILKPFGWGLYAFDKYLPEFQASYLATNKTVTNLLSPQVVHSPFNEFLNIGVTVGLISLILFIFLIGLIIYYGIKSKDRVLFPVLAFLIISLFYFPFKISPLVSLVIPFVALISIRIRNLPKRLLPECFLKVVLVIMFFTASVMAVRSINIYSQYKKWQNAYLFSLEEDEIIKSKKLFSELYPTMKSDGRFLITYSNLNYDQGNYNEALQLLEEAETYFCDITLSLKLAQLYEKMGFYEKAEKKYDLAINLAPNNITAAYEKILFYHNIGENQKAYNASIELINKPVRNSSFADPYIIRSQLKKLIIDYEQHNKE